jgi:hypothetical protein
VLQLWVQPPGQETAASELSEDAVHPDWYLKWSQEGQVMPSSAATKQLSEEDGVRRVHFMPDDAWPSEDANYSTKHPRPMELGLQKEQAANGAEVLVHWVLKAWDEENAA